MRKIWFKIFLLTIIYSSQQSAAQNLVRNSSFEDYITCPFELDQLNYCKFWYNPTDASPDYFCDCPRRSTNESATGKKVGVPTNIGGFQSARTGCAYVGIINFDENYFSYREFIATKLIQTLIKGNVYKVTFYVSLSDKSDFYSTQFGVGFSGDSLLKKQFSKTNEYNTWDCQTAILIRNFDFCNDTASWPRLSIDYLANGNEKFLFIGLFNSVFTKCEWKKVKRKNKTGWGDKEKEAYYYIDDVSVIKQ